jgi:hypothetical protein
VLNFKKRMEIMQEFKSKIDNWLLFILISTIILSLYCAFFAALDGRMFNYVLAILIVMVGAGLPLWLLVSTRYMVSARTLEVFSGPFSWSIVLSSISSVQETRNPLSSPALSLDRLQIEYGGGKTILISPVNKSEFRDAIGHPKI